MTVPSDDDAPAADDVEVGTTVAGPLAITVDPALLEFVPGFHGRASDVVARLPDLITAGAFDEVRQLAHRLRGTGGTYGFTGLSELGARLEDCAVVLDGPGARRHARAMAAYLRRVRWTSG